MAWAPSATTPCRFILGYQCGRRAIFTRPLLLRCGQRNGSGAYEGQYQYFRALNAALLFAIARDLALRSRLFRCLIFTVKEEYL